MLRAVAFLALASVLYGCQHSSQSADALYGRWKLQQPKGCEQPGIKSDSLLLHADGTMEQQVVFADGTEYSSKVEHWRFLPPNTVASEKRLNVEVGPRGVSQKEKRTEALIVEFTHPPPFS